MGRGGRLQSWGTVAAAIAVALSLLLAPAASAEKFTGDMKNAKSVKLLTNQRDEFRFIYFRKYRVDCNDGYVTYSSGFRQPVDVLRKNSFKDADALFPSGDGIDYTVRGKVRGKRVSDTRWTGLFDVSVTVKQNGDVVNRCRTPKLRWTVNSTKR